MTKITRDDYFPPVADTSMAYKGSFPPPKDVFKTANHSFLTIGLFFEFKLDTYPYLYTLKDEDCNGAKSLKKLYLEERDQTEYGFANKYFFNYDHWIRITENSSIKPHIEKWRFELASLLLRDALREIDKIATTGKSEQTRLSAAKYLAEKPWEGKVLSAKEIGRLRKRGRPSKEEQAGYLKQTSEDEARLLEVADRLDIKH